MAGDRITIGITGGIGSGKSIVSRILRCNGFPVFDCDAEAKGIMVRNHDVKDSLISGLGGDIYDPSGELNRQKLASLIFSDSEKRNFVNGIVHKAVRDEINDWRKKIDGYFFIESAILMTGGISSICDYIWLVISPDRVRYERVKKRDNMTFSEISRRMKSQGKEFENIPKQKEVLIENDGQHPLLKYILELTNKYQLQNTYLMPC